MSDEKSTFRDTSLRKESIHSHKSDSLKTTNGTSLESDSRSSQTSIINILAEVVVFDYSFGYDCRQHFNLCVVDEKTLIFYSGTLIHIFHTENKELEFMRSFSGSGIGHIVKNPNENHLAVGEKGVNPLIVIYQWPSFDVISKLSKGTTHAYSHLGYSPDGTMLVSQGKEPDHMITVWNWIQEQIILRVKSHGQDVFNVEFSQFVPGQLTTSGLGHIKFWKMAKTFTGLKLQGELGRFGKTEICDILGLCAMPDEKVISGSEWGNLLVWEDRLIKLEVRQKAKGNCHNAAISQIHFNPDTQDVMSVGQDGWIKMWTRSTIDAADPPDQPDWYLEMQPLFELEVCDELGPARLMYLSKRNPHPENNEWFAQDGDGGIWAVNLSAEGSESKRLLTCHSGAVADIAASPLGHFLASLGSDGRLLIHDVVTKDLLITKKFLADGTSLLWLPIHVEASGAVLVGGFSDGMLRVFVVYLRELQRLRRLSTLSITPKLSVPYINIIQLVKPHSAAVTQVCLNPRGSILVSGSQDKTIFVHQILPKREYITLVPIGFVQLMAPICYITWKPKHNETAIVACADSSVVQVTLPQRPFSYTSMTYCLDLDSRVLRFQSMKSQLIQAEEMRQIELKKEAKLQRKQAELNKIKADNPNLDIDEELFLMDSDEELEFPPLYLPETPSPILFVMMLPNDNLWLSMGGFDCGYFYEYSFNTLGFVSSKAVPEALNIPVHCFLSIFEKQVLALGMANGVIRLVHCNEGVPDLTNYYELAMHDPDRGEVVHLCVSDDGSFLYSCGSDGNVFSYRLNPLTLWKHSQVEILEKEMSRASSKFRKSTTVSGSIPKDVVEDENGEKESSLEERKRNAERLLILKLADEHKESIRRKLANLRIMFELIVSRNIGLPESQRLPHSHFELDPRISNALQDKIDAELALMLRKLAYRVMKARLSVKKMQNHFVDKIASLDVTVRAIKNESLRIKAFTHNKLTPEFLQAEEEIKQLLHIKQTVSEMTFETMSRGMGSILSITRHSMVESILKLQPFYNKLTLKARNALVKQNAKKMRRERRAQQWQVFLETKPDIHADDPLDVIAFENAIATVGDFKLKSAESYRVPEDKRITPAQKYWQMLQLLREIFETKEAFNKKVCEVRNSKITLVRRFKQLYHDLDTIQRELNPTLRKQRLPVPKCYLLNNFPEHIFRLEFGADPQIYEPVSDFYDEEFYVLGIKVEEEPVSLDTVRLSLMRWQPNFSHHHLQTLAADDAADSPWDHELKLMRGIRLLHKQEMIIKEMKDGYNIFDETLENLCIDRLTYARDIKLMEIFYLTLHQELIVINSYAGQEDEITHRINSGVQIRNEKLHQKMTIQDSIESKQQDISLWQLKLTDMQDEMAEKLMNNKFSTFLNRIFKKKKVIKKTDDSDSESSLSEDTTDEDFMDDDDDDYVPIKLDENVCPEGCDPEIYQNTINCRNLRYDIEDSILELKKQIEDLQKELQVCIKDLKKLEVDVQRTNEELEVVQFEKQKKLNDIETVVVLNLSQFRHFVTTSKPEDGLVQNPLVFHNETLFTLAGRVRELEKETEAEHIKISQQQLLMQRLNKRCKEMKEIKKTLKKEIEEEIVRKFGEVIDVDLMEESVLKKMISQARRDHQVELLRKKYDKNIAQLKAEIWNRTEALIRVQRENTRRLKLQTMLEHENVVLHSLLREHSVGKEKVIKLSDLEAFENDVKQLEAILNDQLEFQDHMNEEIRKLSYKATPPKIKEVQKDEAMVTSLKEEMENSEKSKELAVELDDDQTEGIIEDFVSTETIATIDKIIRKLASGSSAYDIALSLVEEMLHLTGDEGRRSSALEVALKLVEELILITTKEDAGDISLVERFTVDLFKLARSESELNVIDLESNSV